MYQPTSTELQTAVFSFDSLYSALQHRNQTVPSEPVILLEPEEGERVYG